MRKRCNMGLCRVIWYWVLLHATAVTQGWNRYQNKSRHRKLTLGTKRLLGLEPGTFWWQVQHSNYWVIPTPKYFVDRLLLNTTNICLSVCNFYGWELKTSLNCTWVGFNYNKVSNGGSETKLASSQKICICISGQKTYNSDWNEIPANTVVGLVDQSLL